MLSPRTPFTAYQAGVDPRKWPLPFRGTVTLVEPDPSGHVTFVYRVLPDLAVRSSGSANREVAGVVLLQPSFGSLLDPATAPTGVVFSPVVGSRVLCVFDGVRWVIIGCYTGPVATPREKAASYDQRGVGYNPGIEQAIPRMYGAPALELPAFFGYEPGDLVLGKGLSRVKVLGAGVIVGASPVCMRFYKADGGVLEYCAYLESRQIGRWARTSYLRGNQAVQVANSAAPHLAAPPVDAATYQCEVLDTSPFDTALQPYLVRRTGHVSRSFVDMGRRAVLAAATPQTIAEERVTREYALIHDTVVQPITDPVPGQDELAATAAAQYDFQVDANGSFRLRAGNAGDLPGGQSKAATGQLDFSLEYDATQHELLLRVGTAGTEGTVIRLKSQTSLDATVEVETTNLKATVRQAATVEAKQLITLRAPQIVLDGAVTMTQTAQVMGILTALQDVLVGRALVTPILASGTPATGPVPTPMTMQGGLSVTGPVVSDTAVAVATPGGTPVTLATHTHLYAPGPGTPTPTAPGVG